MLKKFKNWWIDVIVEGFGIYPYGVLLLCILLSLILIISFIYRGM